MGIELSLYSTCLAYMGLDYKLDSPEPFESGLVLHLQVKHSEAT